MAWVSRCRYVTATHTRDRAVYLAGLGAWMRHGHYGLWIFNVPDSPKGDDNDAGMDSDTGSSLPDAGS